MVYVQRWNVIVAGPRGGFNSPNASIPVIIIIIIIIIIITMYDLRSFLIIAGMSLRVGLFWEP